MPEGVIGGGWAYVIAVYSITGVVLAVYTWSLLHRRSSEIRRGREDD